MEQNKSEGTITFYQYYLYRIMRDLNKTPDDDFLDFTQLKVYKYIRYLHSTGISPRTTNKYITTLNTFFKHKNLSLHFKFLKMQTPQFLENVITEDEALKLLNYLREIGDDRLYSLVACLYYSGIRISEALKLKENQIHEKTTIVTGKGKSRKIFINDALRSILEDYATRYHIKGYLWDDCYGHDTTHDERTLKINKLLKKAGKKLGIDERKLHCHSFRHLFCLRLLASGLSVNMVASIVGHSNIQTTFQYLKGSESDVYEVFNKIA